MFRAVVQFVVSVGVSEGFAYCLVIPTTRILLVLLSVCSLCLLFRVVSSGDSPALYCYLLISYLFELMSIIAVFGTCLVMTFGRPLPSWKIPLESWRARIYEPSRPTFKIQCCYALLPFRPSSTLSMRLNLLTQSLFRDTWAKLSAVDFLADVSFGTSYSYKLS